MPQRNFRLAFAATCAALIACAATLFHAAPASAAAADGKISFEIYKASFIGGISGGSGTLTFKGKSYPLSIGGVSLGASIGLSKAELVGEVLNLKSAADIAGIYKAVSGSYAIAGGDKIAELENAKGVRLKVKGKQIGVEVSLDLSGLQIDLKK